MEIALKMVLGGRTMESTLNQILEKLNVIGQDQAELKRDVQELKGMKKDVQDLKTDVNELKADFNELKADFNELKADVNELKADVNELKADVQDSKTRLKKVETVVIHIPKHFEVLENSVGNEMKRLADIQERQQRTLDLLSARSVEHEAEIKALKWAVNK
jgi:peptidoglycan hydrolase CwlO-like protein